MTVPPEPEEYPPGARDVVISALPAPLSEQNPPDIPTPETPDPDPGGGATIAT